MKLTVDVSKKVGQPGDGSLGASFDFELEADDAEELLDRAR
jgi:hypothetical protein